MCHRSLRTTEIAMHVLASDLYSYYVYIIIGFTLVTFWSFRAATAISFVCLRLTLVTGNTRSTRVFFFCYI